MNTKWTPGPWRVVVRPSMYGDYGTIEGPTGRVIGNWSKPEARANLTLQAAAPAMYEALAAIVEARDSAALADDPAYTLIDRAIDAGRKQLAAARGEAQS